MGSCNSSCWVVEALVAGRVWRGSWWGVMTLGQAVGTVPLRWSFPVRWEVSWTQVISGYGSQLLNDQLLPSMMVSEWLMMVHWFMCNSCLMMVSDTDKQLRFPKTALPPASKATRNTGLRCKCAGRKCVARAMLNHARCLFWEVRGGLGRTWKAWTLTFLPLREELAAARLSRTFRLPFVGFAHKKKNLDGLLSKMIKMG